MQESTKHTPFEAMYVWSDCKIACRYINSEKDEDPVIRLAAYQELADPDQEDKIQEKRECIKLSVKKNIKAEQKRQKSAMIKFIELLSALLSAILS
jgi:hypothetical protein